MTDSLLLDTDVASYLFKASPLARPFRPLVVNKSCAIAFVSVAELFRWSAKQRWGQRKIELLESALRHYTVIPFDMNMAWIWARVMVACDSAGQSTSPTDVWIAAAALRYDIPLLTNNIKHFEAAEQLCGLKLCRW